MKTWKVLDMELYGRRMQIQMKKLLSVNLCKRRMLVNLSISVLVEFVKSVIFV
jgi:hypothetical protein